MLKTARLTMISILVLTAVAASAAPTGGWFDLENCAMCKNLTSDQELFDNMDWDNQLFANGVVEITSVPPHFQERYGKLMAKMQATVAKMQSGEQLPMCNMCMSYGALMMAGATMDQITSGNTHITVISSRDPKVVEKIRRHGQTTIDEFAKMMAAEGEGDHGHDHGHDHQH